jgi:hypothetical protein
MVIYSQIQINGSIVPSILSSNVVNQPLKIMRLQILIVK